MRDKQFGLSEKSENGASSNHRSTSNHFKHEKTITKKDKQNIDMIDKIHEQPMDEQGT